MLRKRPKARISKEGKERQGGSSPLYPAQEQEQQRPFLPAVDSTSSEAFMADVSLRLVIGALMLYYWLVPCLLNAPKEAARCFKTSGRFQFSLAMLPRRLDLDRCIWDILPISKKRKTLASRMLGSVANAMHRTSRLQFLGTSSCEAKWAVEKRLWSEGGNR